MLKALEQLEALSMELMEFIDEADMEDIENYMNQREVYFQELQSMNAVDWSPHLEQVKLIQEMDRHITKRMQELKSEASAEINKFQNAKKNKSAYESAYQDTNSSYFFDSRK
ncbi:hypothetical protein [Paenibacillus puerhi]|uniref:hypothetical protein n=1 Tax=Paenibacillus puerhi TaxID=2692622 RepID=UPI00135C4C9B|nr:hypothetical protein [Paenibacillus puerhi]